MEKEEMDTVVENVVKKITEKMSGAAAAKGDVGSCPHPTLFGCKSDSYICAHKDGFACDLRGAKYVGVMAQL